MSVINKLGAVSVVNKQFFIVSPATVEAEERVAGKRAPDALHQKKKSMQFSTSEVKQVV